MAFAHNLLVLARPLVEGCYRPWAIAVEPAAQAYMETMTALPAFQEWTRAGLAETHVIERFENV